MRVALVHINYKGPAHEGYQIGLASLTAELQKDFDADLFVINDDADFQNLIDYKPTFVGIYAIETYKNIIGVLTEYIKMHLPKTTIILGGPYPTIWPKCLDSYKHIDGIFRGEGELGLPAYLKTKNKKIVGFTWKNGNNYGVAKPLTVQELQSLATPYRGEYQRKAIDDCTWDKYDSGKGMIHFSFTRGCPCKCGYCANSIYNKQTGNYFARMRTVEQAIIEIQEATENFKFGTITFEDDILTCNYEWFLDFMDAYKHSIYIPFEINTHTNFVDTIQLESLAEANCKLVRMGIESGSDKIRRIMERPRVTNEQIYESFATVHQLGMNTLSYNIIGSPYETPEDFRLTAELNNNITHDADIRQVTHTASLTVFFPARGTKLGELCYKHGWIRNDIPDRVAHEKYILNTPYMNERDIHICKGMIL